MKQYQYFGSIVLQLVQGCLEVPWTGIPADCLLNDLLPLCRGFGSAVYREMVDPRL
jgi:hypothetical protein